MPNRIIKESLCESEKISRLSDFEFRLWIGLIVSADDYGRGDARPAIIKGRVFPLRERVTIKDIDAALHGLTATGCISLYNVGGKSYYEFSTWAEHQRVRNQIHKYPGPEEADTPETGLPKLAANCGNLRPTAADCGELRPESESRIQNPNPNTKSRLSESELEAEFEAIWKLYPRKQGKTDALKAYVKARKSGVAMEDVKKGVENYANYLRICQVEEKYIKHGSTWFYQHCWNDTYQPVPLSPGQNGIPMGATGELGQAELEAIQQLLREDAHD